MDPKRLKILRSLCVEGTSAYTDLAPIIAEMYPFPEVHKENINIIGVAALMQNAFRIVQQMKAEDWIKVQDFSLNAETVKANLQDNRSWIHGFRIMAMITQKGYEKLEEEISKSSEVRLTESMLETNQSMINTNTATVNNYRVQSRNALLSIILAGISVAFIISNVIIQACDKSSQHLKEIEVELQGTRQEVRDLRAALNQINSTLEKRMNDTPFVGPSPKNIKH